MNELQGADNARLKQLLNEGDLTYEAEINRQEIEKKKIEEETLDDKVTEAVNP